jgi:hypothetical protein
MSLSQSETGGDGPAQHGGDGREVRMSHTAAALIALAALISLVQCSWVLAADHVDLMQIPLQYRRRVRWVRANSRHVHAVTAVVAVCGIVLLVLA